MVKKILEVPNTHHHICLSLFIYFYLLLLIIPKKVNKEKSKFRLLLTLIARLSRSMYMNKAFEDNKQAL